MFDQKRVLLGLLVLTGVLCWFVCCQQLRQSYQKPEGTQSQPPIQSAGLAQVVISCRDGATDKPIPVRWTLVDEEGRPGIYRLLKVGKDVASRPRQGILYTLGQPVVLLMRPGQYTFYATRGMSWGLGKREVQLQADRRQQVALELQQEIDTSGYLAVDPHIHTLTYSKHGDIQVAERMLTIAGEAIDIAIATDHNANVDYRPFQKQTETESHFKSIIGNEVGSLQNGQRGHINVYPVAQDAFVPHAEFGDWGQLMQDIAKTRASFWTLNHPRWPLHEGNPAGPLAHFGFNRIDGTFLRSPQGFPFPGMELFNADTALTKRGSLPLYLFQDWFALLNHGEQVAGVAGSDSHTVQIPVGHARTYIRRPAEGRLSAHQIAATMRKGHSVLSMGLFVTMSIAEVPGSGPGTIAKLKGGSHFHAEVRLQAASWIRPRRVLIYQNGQLVGARKLSLPPGKPTRKRLRFALATPPHDAHLVAIAFGDPVTTPPQWQGELMQHEQYTVGATNPIFLDVDGQQGYSSPRATARRLLKQAGDTPAKVWPHLTRTHPVIGVQMMSQLRKRWARRADRQRLWQQWLQRLASQDSLYRAYSQSLTAP